MKDGFVPFTFFACAAIIIAIAALPTWAIVVSVVGSGLGVWFFWPAD